MISKVIQTGNGRCLALYSTSRLIRDPSAINSNKDSGRTGKQTELCFESHLNVASRKFVKYKNVTKKATFFCQAKC